MERPTEVSHAPRAQEVSSNHLVYTEEVHGENQSGTTGRVGIQKARHAAISSIPEQEIVEPSCHTACAEQVEVDSCDDRTEWNRKRKRSNRTTTGNHKAKNGGLDSSNEEIHLTCSNHTRPECTRIRNPIQQPDPASDENPFDPADIDRIVARLCPPRKQVSQARSNALENTDATLPQVHQLSDTLHSQAAQNVGIGSTKRNSSKKRGGRGPTKLIEPRREADRPVLTPNNAE
ncbi:hypothetical protein PR202_ga27600 [Eleusine coracana subsp. coracana]|uniref:Uncharacterized protein n=1 Tax=Eleusine coracana subsp. coracana TaxID=191504 RepID=A0AAV5DH21_ELECO|nr:hypothetical protein PR202_ga27578 [Eleusine coracana subsp. coracana]GJN09582.1 hypothetical protein PR202_ga27600 [Eleusine coracana subsp. coracana]